MAVREAASLGDLLKAVTVASNNRAAKEAAGRRLHVDLAILHSLNG